MGVLHEFFFVSLQQKNWRVSGVFGAVLSCGGCNAALVMAALSSCLAKMTLTNRDKLFRTGARSSSVAGRIGSFCERHALRRVKDAASQPMTQRRQR